jgi:hypothetical protein
MDGKEGERNRGQRWDFVAIVMDVMIIVDEI